MTPGKIVHTFTTKSGKKAEIRYPQSEDAVDLMEFINTISKEDTFIRFAGEQQTLEGEQTYLDSEIALIERGDAVKLFCYVDGQMAGGCDIHRDTGLLTRRQHVGIFGLLVAEKFRGEGIGTNLMTATIQEGKQQIVGMRMIMLDCFSTNVPACNLYKKMGFKEVGRIPQALFHKGAYVDEIEMVLPLIERTQA